MRELYAAIEEAVQEAAEDTGLDEDVVFYDVALMVLQFWPNVEDAARYARAHGWERFESLAGHPHPEW